MTNYTILKFSEAGGGVWHERGDADATSPARAIRTLDAEEGIFVAVPTRSFRPLEVKVEQTTKVTIG